MLQDCQIFYRLDSETTQDVNDLAENPIEFNAKKRKLLGEGIQESFLNPKPFKIEKMVLPSSQKTQPNSKKTPKHHFNII